MKLFITSLLLLSSTAFANVSGNWIGWMDWTFQGQGTRCDATLNLVESSKELHRKGGFVDCGVVTMESLEAHMMKAGDRLIIENEDAGSWKENHFEWTEKYEENVIIKTTIDVEANHMDYHEEWIDGERPLYDLKGRFFRQ